MEWSYMNMLLKRGEVDGRIYRALAVMVENYVELMDMCKGHDGYEDGAIVYEIVLKEAEKALEKGREVGIDG